MNKENTISTNKMFGNFNSNKATRLLKKYELQSNLRSLAIVMKVKDELSLIEKLMIQEIKQNIDKNKT